MTPPALRPAARRTLPRSLSAVPVLGAAALGLLYPQAAPAQVSPAPPPGPAIPGDAERVGEDLYRLGRVTVDLRRKTASCAGKINMRRGTVEYLAVTPTGKLHESLLSLDVRPLHLQLALILLGLEPKGGLRFQGDTQPPRGAPVRLQVGWQRAGRPVCVPAEQLLWNVDRKRPMEAGAWVFSGSRVTESGFAADDEGSLVGTYRDPVAIINNALPTGSDDSIYKVNERVAPPLGTPITFTVAVSP